MASHTIIVHALLNNFRSVPPFRNQGVSFSHVPLLHTLLQPPKAATVKEIQGRQDGQGPAWPARVSPADRLQAKVDRPGAQGSKLGAAFFCKQPDLGSWHAMTL